LNYLYCSKLAAVFVVLAPLPRAAAADAPVTVSETTQGQNSIPSFRSILDMDMPCLGIPLLGQ
jgi:hypothetical protein